MEITTVIVRGALIAMFLLSFEWKLSDWRWWVAAISLNVLFVIN